MQASKIAQINVLLDASGMTKQLLKTVNYRLLPLAMRLPMEYQK